MTNTVLERSAVSIHPESSTRLGRKKLLLSGLAFALGLTAAWYGYDWWTVGRFLESTDGAYAGGNVTAIAPHVAGFVSRILVTDNQYVQAGQLLIRLDDRDFRAAGDHADAVVRQREAALASLQARYALQQSAIRQAVADVAAKAARAAFAKEDETRYRSLAQSSFGSLQNAQKALMADQEARSEDKSEPQNC